MFYNGNFSTKAEISHRSCASCICLCGPVCIRPWTSTLCLCPRNIAYYRSRRKCVHIWTFYSFLLLTDQPFCIWDVRSLVTLTSDLLNIYDSVFFTVQTDGRTQRQTEKCRVHRVRIILWEGLTNNLTLLIHRAYLLVADTPIYTHRAACEVRFNFLFCFVFILQKRDTWYDGRPILFYRTLNHCAISLYSTHFVTVSLVSACLLPRNRNEY